MKGYKIGLWLFLVILLPILNCKKEKDVNIEEINFNPAITYGSMSDQDGNKYKTVTIGTQVWMAENLRATRFNNNSSIPQVIDTAEWVNLKTPGYCWYDNDPESNKNTYGALYNWYAVNTGKLCPSGWHVPSSEEWITLRSYLGGEDVAGGKLKESGTSHWQKPNAGATNESGFTALPGGARGIVGTGNKGKFGGQGVVCYWWSVTGISAEPFSQIFGFCINKDYSRLFRNEFYFTDGISVRCLKD